MLTKSLAQEFGPYGIRVNAVAPGLIEVDEGHVSAEYKEMFVRMVPRGRIGRPELLLVVGLSLCFALAFVAEGIGLWTAETVAHSFGVILGIGQVMILVAVAAALATRLPFVVNLVVCLMLYFLGHLAPVVVKVTERGEGGGVGRGLVRFLGQLFDTLLPALEFFNMGPAVIREIPLNLWQFGWYVLTVLGYSLIYTVIALLVGLLLFEDRDLA